MSRIPVLTIRKQFLIASAALVLCAISGRAQPGSNASAQAAQPVAAESPGDIISFLNQTIVWSRQLTAEQQLVNEPSDALFLNDNRQIANQVIRLAFEYARARAQALANSGGEGGAGQSQASSQYQRLIDSAIKADQQVKSLQKELDGFHQQLLTATGRKRTTLLAVISETEGELELFQTRRDTLRNMLQFAATTTSSGAGSGNLPSQVEELARTVPAASAGGKEVPEANPAAANAASPTAVASRERK